MTKIEQGSCQNLLGHANTIVFNFDPVTPVFDSKAYHHMALFSDYIP